MRWASAVSTATELEHAIAEAVDVVRPALGDAAPDLAVVFVSEHYRGAWEGLAATLGARLRSRVLVGCSAGGAIGGGREVERRVGVAVTAALLPDVDVQPFHVESDAFPSDGDRAAWRDVVPMPAPVAFVVLPDPFSCDAERLIRGFDATFAGATTVGGIASGGRAPGETALFLDGTLHRSGCVGVALGGRIAVDTIVAQGCRPIGDPMFVTRADRHLLLELDGRRPVEVLGELMERVDARDRELAGQSLFLGIVMRERQHEYHQGDFLIRNLLGLDPKSGAIAVGAVLAPGMVVQFHLRDAATSRRDLDAMLRAYGDVVPAHPPAGALLFSCLGRGEHLYGRPNHDTDAFRRHLGVAPLGGFFCNGEIGPVHGTTFVHGYTSAFALFRPPA